MNRQEFQFGPAGTKEVGDIFTMDGERWRVLRERLDLQPFQGGQRIYTCERIETKEEKVRNGIKRARLAEQWEKGRHYSVAHFDEDATMVQHLNESRGSLLRLDDNRLSLDWASDRDELRAQGFTHLFHCYDGGSFYIVEVV